MSHRSASRNLPKERNSFKGDREKPNGLTEARVIHRQAEFLHKGLQYRRHCRSLKLCAIGGLAWTDSVTTTDAVAGPQEPAAAGKFGKRTSFCNVICRRR